MILCIQIPIHCYIFLKILCVLLLYDNVVVWKQSFEPYPVSIYFKSHTFHDSYDFNDSPNCYDSHDFNDSYNSYDSNDSYDYDSSTFIPRLYLNFDPYYYTYVYDGNMWVLRKDLSHCYSFKLDPSMHPKDITIVTESGGSKESTTGSEESPSSSAGYTVYDHGDGIYLYDFGNARCSEVMYCGQTVSKRQSGGPYPRRIVFDTETLTFEFDFKNKTAVYKLNGGWYISEVYDNLEYFKYEFPDWICKQSYHRFGSKLSMKNLKILTSDESDGSGAKPINVHSSMLLYEKWQFGYYYPVHTLYLELRYKNQVLFKSTEYPYRGRPRIVLFDENNNTIWVFFSSGFSFSLNYIDHSDETVLKAEPSTHTEPVVESKTEPSNLVVEPIVIHSKTTSVTPPNILERRSLLISMLLKVSYPQSVIWESTNNVCITVVKIKTTKNVKYLALLLDNNMFLLLNQNNDKWTNLSNTKRDIKKFKFLDDNDSELTMSEYIVSLVDFSFCYSLHNCVIFYNNCFSTLHDDTEFGNISLFSFSLISNSFYALNADSQQKTIKPKSEIKTKEPKRNRNLLSHKVRVDHDPQNPVST
ncbi:SfiI-subtelomeric fragment related protein family member, putative [Theileria annulata]|uniref:SfiI-subtelomeric related protein family member, putative n=1 Tax=Theileria annulata TaxID=5874 RepID=Q4UJ65_THEAN|nr:SfiI-subtelomeric fragment related protein family member, putative [Theileria annulata]CAI72874.1 SfiI-subtelomeric fragment related protein family member, putative [Theileria annulata]